MASDIKRMWRRDRVRGKGLSQMYAKRMKKAVLPILAVVWNQTDTFSLEVPV